MRYVLFKKILGIGHVNITVVRFCPKDRDDFIFMIKSNPKIELGLFVLFPQVKLQSMNVFLKEKHKKLITEHFIIVKMKTETFYTQHAII